MWGRRGTVLRGERDEHYSVGAIFGLMSVALLLAAGAAVDYARVADMRETMETAVSSASLAVKNAMRATKLSDDEITAIAMSHFDSKVALARRVGTIEMPTVSIDHKTRSLTIDAKGAVAMTVSQLGGIKEITVPATSTVSFASLDSGLHQMRVR